MGGPIVRTGTNPKFWEGWDLAFGGKKKTAAKPSKKAPKTTARAKAGRGAKKKRK